MAPSGPGTPHYGGFTITFRHTLTGLLWTNGRPVAETSTWLHTTITWDTHPCSQRDSNLQSYVYYMCTTVQYALITLCSKISICYSRYPALCDHSSPGVRSSTRNENRTRDKQGCNWHWSVPSATFPPSGWRSPVHVGIAAGFSLSEEDPTVRWRISPCAASLNTFWLRTGVRNGL